MAIQGLYKGYSSVNFMQTKNFALRDMQLVKRDLMNHIYTRKGERRMMCQYGTIIPDVPFEQLTDSLLEAIYSDLERVFDMDPRVDIIKLDIFPVYDKNTIVVEALLGYKELQVVDALIFELSTNSI